MRDPKVGEIVKDLTDYSALASQLAGYDACFFCLGITSAGMSEPEYRRVTYDLTTTEELGRAILQVAKHGASQRVLESADIRACSGA